MGWDYMHRPKGKSVREFIIDMYNDDGELIDVYIHGNVAYGAYRRHNGDVIALVLLLQQKKDYFNFGVREMSETMLPLYYDCPRRILDLLTPTQHEAALRWREECYARSAVKFDVGDVVILDNPVTFSSGHRVSTFTVVSKRPFRLENSGRQYFITPDFLKKELAEGRGRKHDYVNTDAKGQIDK